MSILDGKTLAATIRAQTADLVTTAPTRPTLAVVTATEDESSAWYVRTLLTSAEKVGLGTRLVTPEPTATALAAALDELGADPGCHGIILQTPLPTGVDADDLVRRIPVGKDVDGANPLSAGLLMGARPGFAPATAAAVMALLDAHEVALRGARAVVIGRSLVVGKPVAMLLLARDATVTVAHSRTRDLPAVAREADVLVVAIGRPGFVDASFVKPGAVVVDVGTTPDAAGTLVGDVDFAAVEPVAAAVSPVPGGVGPVTTAILLRNTALAATA